MAVNRYSQRTSLVLVTHGLALRVFLMRWFHWSVDQFMQVFNPPNAEVRTCFTQLLQRLFCLSNRWKQPGLAVAISSRAGMPCELRAMYGHQI